MYPTIGLWRHLDFRGSSRVGLGVMVLVLALGIGSLAPPMVYGQDTPAIEAIRKRRSKPTPKPTPRPAAKTGKSKPKSKPRPVPRKPTPKPRRVAAISSKVIARPIARTSATRVLRLPPGIRLRTNPVDGAQMVWIPAGEFVRGSEDKDSDAGRDEKTWRAVYLDGYWMYRYPVTVAQYKKFCTATRRKMPPAPPWGWKSDHPIVQVTWDDSMAYASWAKANLPTEAQWEKAARGRQGQKYPWGHNWDPAFCVNKSNSNGHTASVYRTDRIHQSPYGVRDMAGNVWQWCRDWWEEGYYDYSPPKNPTGPGKGKNRALRGGSWKDNGPLMDREPFRAADRGFAKPEERSTFRGFRCTVNRP